MEEARGARLSSSPSRHSILLPGPIARRTSKLFARAFRHTEPTSGSYDSDGTLTPETDHSIGASESAPESRHVTPLSTPGTSIAHGDLGSNTFCDHHRSSQKKRLSWFGSTPASQWTSHRAPTCNEGLSPPPPTRVVRSKPPFHSCSSSWSSSSGSSANHGLSTLERSPQTRSQSTGESHTVQQSMLTLAPNAQFLGLMLLMILLISSPLIKVLSVLLFIVVVWLDDS